MTHLLKQIAPRTISINGYVSPCDCTDTITCAYCVQANLILMEKQFSEQTVAANGVLKAVKRNGIRKTARKIGVEEKSLRRWIKSGNIPFEVTQKLIACGQP